MLKTIPKEVKEKILGNIPMNRFGSPEEIAEVVMFLCSKGAGYITGAVIDINGGFHT